MILLWVFITMGIYNFFLFIYFRCHRCEFVGLIAPRIQLEPLYSRLMHQYALNLRFQCTMGFDFLTLCTNCASLLRELCVRQTRSQPVFLDLDFVNCRTPYTVGYPIYWNIISETVVTSGSFRENIWNSFASENQILSRKYVPVVHQ